MGYCCQYRESAFNFLSRLMEIEGIYYFFRQEMGKHTMVVTDSNAFLQPCPYQARFRYEHDLAPGSSAMRTRFQWFPERSVGRPGTRTRTTTTRSRTNPAEGNRQDCSLAPGPAV